MSGGTGHVYGIDYETDKLMVGKMMGAKKLHSWVKLDTRLEPRDKAFYKIVQPYFDMKVCKKCGLQKCSLKLGTFTRGHRNFETIYFTLDENNNIIDGTFKKGTLPYTCGYKEKMLLTDADFEIDI